MEAKLPMQPPNNTKKIAVKISCIKIFYFFLDKNKQATSRITVGRA